MSTDIIKHQGSAPANLDGSVRFAQLLADADLLPRQFVNKPANVLYAVEYGRTLGITPIAAITGIHVIEGKPSASAGLIGGLVRQAGHKLRVKSDGKSWATAQIVRADDPDFTYECTWDLERAAQASLCEIKNNKPWARDRNGKPTAWEKYPAAMLKARAITEVARDACEDVLFGLHYTPEELGAIVNQDGEPVEAEVQQLRRVEPDQWATPAPTVQAGTADLPPESLTPAGRDYLHEAHAAPDAATVRQIWQDAKTEGGRPDYLEQIAAVGREKASTEQESAAPEGVVDAEVVPDEDADHAAAVAELRAAAEAANLSDFEQGAYGALGCSIEDASANALRALAAQIRPAA
ncbi:hypothetical protein GCM10010317_077800 [Streptomyces mirabilis]|uniref:hypothetical protein n=1 Tax=Streptomyces mirabilis TaxID=68239 RepID=UPI00167CA376|nr:hypothetical protein [Streptomyces mirabilis]GHD70460.1 hypothetical protein GCM10010317_077800 [Streptomyces mirabilis]